MERSRYEWLAAIGVVIVCLASRSVLAQEAPPAQAPIEITLIQIIKWGSWIGYVIILLSVVTFALVIRSALVLRKSVLCPEEAKEKVTTFFRERKIKEALEFCRNDNSLMCRIIEGGLLKVRGGWSTMDATMNDLGEEENLRLQQQVGYFALLAAISPMLGLLGTVVGMVGAFNQIANNPAGVTSARMMADQIQMALITTVFGLIVAIPDVCAYTYFKNRLERLMMDLSLSVDDVMSPFKGLKPAPAAPPAKGAKPADAQAGAPVEKPGSTSEAPVAASESAENTGGEAVAVGDSVSGESEQTKAEDEHKAVLEAKPAGGAAGQG
jgi:biopolymer transport protein ExbB